jgi:hypothetical protein
MSAQMESGQVLDTDQVNALVALIKLGKKDITYEMIDNAAYELEVGYFPLA